MYEPIFNSRSRIEQLKQELGEAQDDIDSTNTTIRRLDRTNDELTSQCEGLQVQVEHLTSRLRSMPISDHLSPFRRISRMSAPGGIKSSTLQDFAYFMTQIWKILLQLMKMSSVLLLSIKKKKLS